MAKTNAPDLSKHFEMLGRITHDWNFLEHQIAVLCWLYTKDIEAAHVFTSRLRNAERAAALLEISERRDARPRVRGAIKFLVGAFNILRENRNALVHSHHWHLSGDDVVWTRGSKSKPTTLITALASLSDLRELHSDIVKAREYADGLQNYLMPDDYMNPGRWVLKRDTLPRRFRKPRKMLQPRPSM